MIAAGLTFFYFVQAGFYPIAVVNSRIIGARSYEEVLASAYHYYDQLLKAEVPARELVQMPEALVEIRRATLDKLVEDVLVYKELKSRLGKETESIVRNKVSSLNLNSPDFRQGVATLYDLTLEEFKETVLVPQARREILEGRLFTEKANLGEWLTRARQEAKVVIFAPNLEWKDGKVTIQ